MSHIIAANLYINLRSAVNFDLWVNKMSNSLLFNVSMFIPIISIHAPSSKYVDKSIIVSRNMCLQQRKHLNWMVCISFHFSSFYVGFSPSSILSIKQKKHSHTPTKSERKSPFELVFSKRNIYNQFRLASQMVFGLILVPGFGCWFVYKTHTQDTI